ncbi:hypothetical protein IVB02_05145 [Bradyrhizobium sp. 166]|uniref:hypothetical protein n=1 Tax=Bradyrhizobium sp. 166 TaxID=2782638 RepID=UPI001FF93503|nr:hypothetical protein [Bradyrhizobium sp. 166]MCK1600821.1 hypothetical protein [Bradyrhizobium sp. 166]
MKIAILSADDVAGWYTATLMERGHEVTIGPFGHAPTALTSMIEDGIDGVLILTDGDDNMEEIAARFTRATGRPVWRNLTEIPAVVEISKRRSRA